MHVAKLTPSKSSWSRQPCCNYRCSFTKTACLMNSSANMTEKCTGARIRSPTVLRRFNKILHAFHNNKGETDLSSDPSRQIVDLIQAGARRSLLRLLRAL